MQCKQRRTWGGAPAKKKTDECWKVIHFASRFLTPFEQKYSIKEIELLAVVWSVENFRNYVYGTNFEIESDHEALTSFIKDNKANKTFSSRLTGWVDRILPFQFTVSHEPGRTLGMADYLSRHPSPSNNNIKLKTGELWNNWLPVNEIDVDKPVLVEQNKQPITGELTNQSELARSSEASSDSELNKQCEQTIKSTIASTNPSANNATKMESSDSETYDAASTIEFASKPPLKTPMCYSVIQIGILQFLGNYTFAFFETDDFLREVITLIQKPDSTKIKRLPAPWREKFKCLSLDKHKYLYMDERLVVPNALRPIILRSLHYGHPGRDSMLSMVSVVWWPRLHREVVGIAKSCPQGHTAGKNIKTILEQKQVGKLPKCTVANQEVAIDFAGPFQNAIGEKVLTSINRSFYGMARSKIFTKTEHGKSY